MQRRGRKRWRGSPRVGSIDATPGLSSLATRVDALDLRGKEIRDAGAEFAIGVRAIEELYAWVSPDDSQCIVSNRVSNAVRAMDGRADKRLTITGTSSSGFLELRVAGIGCGVPEGDRERICERGEMTKTGAGGTGL